MFERAVLRIGRARRLVVIGSAVLVAVASLAPATLAAGGLEISTPYPSVSVAPGSDVSFDLAITSSTDRQVNLAVSGVPDGWTATLRGGGFVVDGVSAGPDEKPDVRLDVTIPATATSGTTRLTVRATAAGGSDELPISITVSTAAAGSVTMTSDFPSLQGPSSKTFTFNLALRNDTAQDLTFGLNAQGQAGWIVSASPSSQAEATSVEVQAGSSETIKVEADPPSDAEAGSYAILVTATSGDLEATTDLSVDITGEYKLEVSTPDGRLNANGTAGSTTDLTLSLTNNGTAPLVNVAPTHAAPSGWDVKFEPETVASIEAGQTVSVVAKITPSSSAVAGDYVVTMRANGTSPDGAQSANSSADIRFTVETSPLFLLVGIGLIILVFAGLAFVFQRYGRR